MATILHGFTYPKIEKIRKKWQHRVTSAGLGGRSRVVRVKHLVTQPGNTPKTRPSHLTTVEAVNKVSPKLAFEDRKGRVLRRMQTLN